MAREHNPLTTNGSVLNMVNEFQGGRAAIGAMLSVDPIRFKNQLHEQKGMRISTETALTIQEFTGRTDFAEAVAHQSGGVFVKMPEHDNLVRADIHETFTETAKNIGLLIQEFLEAIEDGELDDIEHRRLEARKDKACSNLALAIHMIVEVYKRKQSTGESHG